MAADALLIDSTDLTLAEVIDAIAVLARDRAGTFACTGDKRS
jgi:hypothetical protein